MSFEKVKLELELAIRPKYLNDPSTSIFKQLSRYLLQYSTILKGFPLSFEIEGVLPAGRILEDGCVYSKCRINFILFKVAPGDILDCIDGNICGIFKVKVDNEDSYNGEVTVKSVEDDIIIGNKIAIVEDSDF
ncbi:hypothetical protein GINT2_000331 [Glugoides intestinalis]